MAARLQPTHTVLSIVTTDLTGQTAHARFKVLTTLPTYALFFLSFKSAGSDCAARDLAGTANIQPQTQCLQLMDLIY